MTMANYDEPIFNPITKDLGNVNKNIIRLDSDENESSTGNSKNISQNCKSVPSNRENPLSRADCFTQKR